MFLRSLTMRGFKSFADKSVIEFQPGVSVIVGPNGSGKSNLVDAISWVLGEQGARALRGGHMTDVIYTGSPSRAALGMAEVKMVIDNSAGRIPVPMSEIEVSRTIFRSGDSEYRINGQIVRLLDVQELLSETGIGRALHTVVGQGQLEEVLNAKPEDRRRYIEEAAGVAKHRRRKERAERKLAGVEQDLLRLQDVLNELKRQLKPLKQQAEMAGKHEALTAEATELSARLAAARLRALLREKERRKGGWDEGLREREDAKSALARLDEQVLSAADKRAVAVTAFAAAEQSLRQTRVDRAQAEESYKERLQQEAGAREAVAGHAASVARSQAIAAEIERLEAESARIAGELTEAETELAAAESAFRDAEAELRRIEDVRRRMQEDSVGRRAEISALERSLLANEHERERLAEASADLDRRIAEATSERGRLATEIEDLDAQASPVNERLSDLEAQRAALQTQLTELEETRRTQDARRQLLEARKQDIEETPGSKFFSTHRSDAVGLIKDLVQADPGYERALVAALGPIADAVVYADTEKALRDAPSGDGAILAVASGNREGGAIAGETPLLSVVRPDASASGIVTTILRDVYLATDVQEALSKQRRHPSASFVTADGVLVGPAVIHTAREAEARAREIRSELEATLRDIQTTDETIQPARVRLDEFSAAIASTRDEADGLDARISTAAERMAELDRETASLARERDLTADRLEILDGSISTAAARIAETGEATELADIPDLPPAPQSPMGLRVSVETLRRERAGLEERSRQLISERDALTGVDLTALQAALESAETARADAETELTRVEAAALAAGEARDAAAAVERAAAEEESSVNKQWRDASTRLDTLRETYEEQDRDRGDIERRIREAERLIKEGHGADPAEVLGTLSDEDTVETLEKRSEVVQRRLELIGRVNLLAGEEFETLQERHDFMAQELEDVRKAKRDLLEVVSAVDREITETFTSAFDDVAREFEGLIKDLFPGGSGRLILTDPSEPLTSGIEIEATPGRKRVKRISLLSGGERSLTAMAFLFAIFKARPSPFYLMDEVEPALDDTNLHRFLRLLQEFAKHSQILIVTHQKRTMEVASMMYGISLNKDGTTKVVCQRLEHQTSLDVDARLEGDVPPSDEDAAPDSDESDAGGAEGKVVRVDGPEIIRLPDSQPVS